MFPILKIRLIYIKRNLCKNLIQFFYPTLFVLLIIGIFNTLLPSKKPPPPIIHNTTSFSLFELSEMLSYEKFQFGIICQNENVRDKFKIFAQTTFCQPINHCQVKTFKTEKDFINYIFDIDYLNQTSFESIIDITVKNSTTLTFKIRDARMEVKSIYESVNSLNFESSISFQSPNVKYWKNYQIIIANFLLYLEGISTPKKNITIFEKGLKSPPVYNMLSAEGLIKLIPLLISISYSSTLFSFVLWMVSEKERKLNDFLYRQGVSLYKYVLSWFYTFLIITIIPALTSSILLYKYFFRHINIFIIFFSEFLFTINIFGLSFLFQSFVESIHTSQTLLKILYLGITILSAAVIGPDVPRSAKVFLSLFPQINLLSNFELFLLLDNYNTIDFTLLNTPYNGITLNNTFIIYIVSFGLYIFFTFVVITTKRSGMNIILYSWMKLFRPGYEQLDDKSDIDDTHSISEKIGIKISHEERRENGDDGENKCLNINQVHKYYGEVAAVRAFSAKLYSNEIFCLLGHNGAGKTTLIKLICGLEDFDKGDIKLFGNSFSNNNKDFLYKNIGLCAQEDIFFDYLTVVEHLRLMSEIKGARANSEEINILIEKIGLSDKKNSITKTLSGGQKRKLCVALALSGNSRLVLLDEPTSGMDVIAKRALWEFLKEYKRDKIMIFTTHSLEEAEYLGDRIGVMSEGRFICSGSSAYLKNEYPCGYNVNLIIDEKKEKRKREELLRELKGVDQSAYIKISSKCVMSINFMNTNSNVKEIFDIIEKAKDDNGIEDFTLSTTSLEDVFLKLSNIEFSKDLFNESNDNSNGNESKNSTLSLNEGERGNGRIKQLGQKKKISFIKELSIEVGRNVIPLWRNKSSFILEIFAASATIFIYILGFSSQLINNNKQYQNINYLLQKNDIFYISNEETAKLIRNSYFIKHHINNKISLKPIPFNIINTNNITIEELSNVIYNKSKYQNERSIFLIREPNLTNIEIFNLYQGISVDYYAASMNMILSTIFERDYNLKISFTNAYSNIPDGAKKNEIELISKIFLTVISIMMIWNSFISLGGYMISTPLKERVNNVKHLLYLSGANMFAYWLSLIIIDLIKHIIFLCIVFPLLIHFESQYWYHLVLFIPFIMALSVFVYSFAFLFDKEEYGQKYYLLFGYLCSIFLPFISLVWDKNYFINIFFSDNFIFSISDLFPPSSLIIAMIRICSRYFSQSLFFKNKLWKVTINHCVILLAQFIFYSLILLLLEKRVISKLVNKALSSLCYQRVNSRDIQLNDNNISNSNAMSISVNTASSFSTIVRKLSKTFWVCRGRNVRAVRGLNFALSPNEKFGLLGVNGSGKTTTFKAITNEIFYDKGDITLFGYDTKKNFNQIRQIVGYCPQENALFDYLTVRETISFYKQLRGIDTPIEDISEHFCLRPYLRRLAKKLSGGNRRKLTFTIALMSNPNILLLDEPSTGIDPESRRTMWKVINDISKQGDKYNMIISSHSMEEAEILCDTIGWLKEGKFAFYGNPEKLKIQFSAGYYFHIKFNEVKGEIEGVNQEEKYNGILEKVINKVGGKDIIIKAIREGYIDHSLEKLMDVIGRIEEFIEKVELKGIERRNAFELLVFTKKEKKGELFSEVIEMKNKDKEISEISFNMESLENILMKC